MTLRLTAEHALLSCRGQSTNLKVATAANWTANSPKGGRKDSSWQTIEQAADYDWTYTPSEMFQVSRQVPRVLPKGTLTMVEDTVESREEHGHETSENGGGRKKQQPQQRRHQQQQQQVSCSIPYEHLKRREPILWSTLVPLYSTELDDNGIAEFSGRVRVMPTCFFCLFRYFLRVDNVLLRCRDVRIFHRFGDTIVLIETTLREGKLVGREQFRTADEIGRVLPVKTSSTRTLQLSNIL